MSKCKEVLLDFLRRAEDEASQARRTYNNHFKNEMAIISRVTIQKTGYT